ncbi:TonB-dependent receptor plug domain-containing protein [Niabella ginsengisoli]|uniref:TonB-dependent receptor n=1 Tax=Niabella ginsengisoli TaxID=522298 RepID=A0ABS9SHK5_9BACT|nr:TonB-dependent receptor plug domain-containing protein [Niabella ginsengisoli]MCH5597853.1 TonB-dependent receptor [Niabella ginsengisoli]
MIFRIQAIIALLLISVIGYAQTTISGVVFSGENAQALNSAVVEIRDNSSQTVLQRLNTDSMGVFSVEVPGDNVLIEISFVGYKPKTIKKPKVVNQHIDLGKILLTKAEVTLEEVVVRAEKSSTEFKLDKRVFNVGQDLSSTGMSALEVLNNVPSVMVNIDGQISLRGNSGVQILINGKPSVLADESSNALGTITADMIERIEVITNPSAKYEAEGTAGILNIILKKKK